MRKIRAGGNIYDNPPLAPPFRGQIKGSPGGFFFFNKDFFGGGDGEEGKSFLSAAEDRAFCIVFFFHPSIVADQSLHCDHKMSEFQVEIRDIRKNLKMHLSGPQI